MQGLVGHLRERMGRVQPHRHQERPHLALEELGHPVALRLIAVRMVEHHDALVAQQRHHVLVEDGVLLVDQEMRLARHALDVAVADLRIGVARRIQHVGKAHLEELVQIAGDDADVAQPLQQRHILALRLGEHPTVELEDRLLAVEQGWRGLGGNGHAGKHMKQI